MNSSSKISFAGWWNTLTLALSHRERGRPHFASLFLLISLLPLSLSAAEPHTHGSQIFHSFRLETEIDHAKDGTVSAWDLRGWIGTDENKLWLKSEGEVLEGKDTKSAELWALYSRNISTFWDAQIGIRHDEKPHALNYLAFGANGLAPYFFETEVHIFVSEKGDTTARLREENDFLITQKFITQPYVEMNVSAQDIPEQKLGAGINNGTFGLQTRYEITRAVAPYIDIHYERKLGETATLARKNREDREDAVVGVGLRLGF